MSFEPIGIFTLLLGLYCLFAGYNAAVIVFVGLSVLGAAAAIIIGSANIQPAHFFLAFLALGVLSYRREFTAVLNALRFPGPAFWLACLLVYGVVLGYFAPRFFARLTDIIPLGASEYDATGGAVPLGPVSSNFTQAVYVSADLLAFTLIVAIGSTYAGFRAVTVGILTFAGANALFAILDIATYGTGAQELFQFIRNARYTFHDEDVVAGVKRIVGSWPEASAFAGISLASVGFTGTLWMCGRDLRWTGALFLATSVLVIRSTSSTGLIGLPVCLVILYGTAVMRCGRTPGSRNSSFVALFAPVLVCLVGLVIALNDMLFRQIYSYFDLLIFSKTTSASAAERGAWNLHGYQNFLDTYGLGVGLGTSRTSSFLFALLSNVGVPGTIFFLLFATSAFFRRRGKPCTFASDVRLAARNGCACLMVGAMVAGPTVDLGLLFFIMAGLASAEPEAESLQEQIMGQPNMTASE
ncbi:hypothetical protein J2X76_002674 [Neorhizobium sp. 2083]|uniref:hypothetical protein n=1 Tax=Neorhizobium sp. 2083 TaxID=2817762 RepID=UPI0028629A60|nr:hypothetical protein [Neorhizobium sp. 2083]MDR6817498.1 hypothetical protein [Neorhizobium sp. 2083]